jgi:hypothetical protein
MKGPARQISIVGKQEVRLRVPDGFRGRKATALSSGQDIAFKMDGSHLVFTVPQVGEYEVIAVTKSA